MNKKEKFYENFNKLKVSPEQALERFEFRDVKTLDGMVSQANSLQSKMTKAKDKYLDLDMKSEDLADAENAADEKVEDQKDKFQKIRDENNKREDKQEEVINKARAQYDKISAKFDIANDKAIKAASEGKSMKSQVESFVDKMEAAIKSFETSAKALGVDVSGKIEKYKSSMIKLHASSMWKFGG